LIYTDAAFFEVQVNAPDSLVLAASGVEINAKKENGRQIVTFAGGPQRDFYLAASSRFQSESRQAGEVKVTSFFPNEYKGSGELVLDTAIKALQVFSRRYGSYPYIELDLVSTPMQAGGMEYSGAAAMSLGLYKTGNTASGAPNEDFLEYATAHEVAHQWFFDQVMNDQLEEPWLDEAFAQYLTYIYYLDTYESSAADQIRASWERYWSSVDNQPIPIGKPSGDYQPKEYTAIIYGRAPFFILELEKKMGSEVFTHFLADYIRMYQWKTTDSRQFKSLAEVTCSCDLTSLFDEWGVEY
jgi:aminopeptidase N